MNRAGRDRATSNPILIGSLTVLATIVAVTLAYNANNGLPFVPSYTLHVQVRDAEELTHGTEVHMGGSLVGNVISVDAARDPSGQPVAVLNLKLQKSIEPLPADSFFTIRLKTSIGLKYLDIAPGNSRQTLPSGATVPLSQTGATVDLDQVFSMFNPPTRAAVAAQTAGFAEGFAGRGTDINDAIAAFVPLFDDLEPVARNLASPQTDFGGFWHGLERFSSALAPVAQANANLYVNLDTTFHSLATVAFPDIQNWISETPPTFSAVIADAPTIIPFLNDTAALFSELRPGFATLKTSAPVLADAFAAGTANLPATAGLDQRTVTLSRQVASYGEMPAVQQGLDRITLTLSSLEPPLAFLTPVQATCNYITLFLRNTASLLSEPNGNGTSLRFLTVAIGNSPSPNGNTAPLIGGEGSPSSRPYLTPNTSSANFYGPLHVDPYPNTDSPGQTPECSAGNEPYSGTAPQIGNPLRNVGLKTETTTRSGG